MKRNLLGLAAIGLVGFGATSCASDPTASLSGTAATITTSLTTINLDIGDSILVNAQTRDSQGVVLPTVPEVASQTPTVVTVIQVPGGPLSQTSFYIKAVGFGEGTVRASLGGVSKDITINTFPANMAITGSVDSLGSGTSIQLAPDPQDALGNSITATGAEYTWSSSAPTIVSVDSLGNASAAAPGSADITVTGPGQGSAGSASGTVTIVVVPGVFSGTLSATAVSPADGITIMPGVTAWDGDEGVLINGDPALILAQSTTSLIAGVPPLAPGTHTLVVTNQGPQQIAGATSIDISGAYSPTASPPGPDITAGPFPMNFFIVLDDTNLDDFFQIAPASNLGLTVRLSWAGGADMDILWVDCPFTTFVGNFNGASTANPETSSVTVPGGDCWSLWFNNYSGNTGPTLLAVNITSP